MHHYMLLRPSELQELISKSSTQTAGETASRRCLYHHGMKMVAGQRNCAHF